jgi:hypothetical protein
MYNKEELKEINAKIRLMQTLADDMSLKGETFPALGKNLIRIKASLKMLELNISEVVDL